MTCVVLDNDLVQNSEPFELEITKLSTMIYKSYNLHYSIELSPELISIEIGRVLAKWIIKYSKELAPFLNKGNTEKSSIKVFIDDPDFADQTASKLFDILKSKFPNELVRLYDINFSQTTQQQKLVSYVNGLSAGSKYFEYEAFTRCGIPSIYFKGTSKDWSDLIEIINDAIFILDFDTNRYFGLTWWWENCLKPTLTEFLNTVNGNPNVDFLRKICTDDGMFNSGKTYYSGWSSVFDPWEVVRGDDVFYWHKYRNETWKGEFWKRYSPGESEPIYVDVTVDLKPKKLTTVIMLKYNEVPEITYDVKFL